MPNTDTLVRLTLRLPREVHEALTEAADNSRRSLNAEIVIRLERSVIQDPPPRP